MPKCNVELYPRSQNCHSHLKPRMLIFWVFKRCCPKLRCWFGFDAILFHLRQREEKVPERMWPKWSTVEPILFLSRLLTTTEKNYRAIELEIAGLVSVIQKIKHWVEFSREQVIIQSDHSSIIDIMQQSSITSNASIMQMNVWLIRECQFLCEFYLSVRHKLKKEYVVPDVLNRLVSANANLPKDPNHSELGVLFAYTDTLVQLSPFFLRKIIRGYRMEK